MSHSDTINAAVNIDISKIKKIENIEISVSDGGDVGCYTLREYSGSMRGRIFAK